MADLERITGVLRDLGCDFVFDSTCEYEGLLESNRNGRRTVVLRDEPLNERVLLHETMHAVFRSALPLDFHGGRAVSFETEEILVWEVTRALWLMGFRLVQPTEPLPSPEATARAREAALAVIRERGYGTSEAR